MTKDEQKQSCHSEVAEPRQHRSKRAAFTLAEVLITLGIIGIVAAMTIPTLVKNYNHRQIETKLKKTYSVLQNAFEMSKSQYGDYDNWYWYDVPADNAERISKFWNTYIFPYLQLSKVCAPSTSECFAENTAPNGASGVTVSNSKYLSFMLKDGTTVLSWTGSNDNVSDAHVQVIVDINGLSKPNQIGQDIFRMIFYPSNRNFDVGSVDDANDFTKSSDCRYASGLYMYGDCSGVSASMYLNSSSRLVNSAGSKNNMACTKDSNLGLTCGAVIKANNWKIPDDYPW